MKVSIELGAEYSEPYAVVYTDRMTEEIRRLIDTFEAGEAPIVALKNEENLVVLKPEEIFMIRIEGGDTIIYDREFRYRSRKRLYELSEQLGRQFMQISKSTLVNLAHMDSIEAGFGGTMLLKLKNGLTDYVSRKYLPDFKKYLGL